MVHLAPLRGGILVVSFFLLGTIWLPVATAQDPVYQVQLNAEPSAATVGKSLGQVRFTYTISIDYDSNPVTDTARFEIVVEYTNKKAIPDGWLVSVSTTSVNLSGPKETATVLVTATLTNDRPARDEFPITLKVTAKPKFSTGIPIPDSLKQQSSDEQTVEARKKLTPAETVTSFVRNYMWLLLGAAGLIFLVAVVLTRKKKGVLALHSDQPTQEVSAGRGASFPVRLTNESTVDDRVRLSLTPLPPRWNAVVPLSELSLRPQESTQIWVTLRAPADAAPGETASFELEAASVSSAQRARTPLQAVVVPAYAPTVPVEPLPLPPPVPPLEDLEIASNVDAEPPAKKAPKKSASRRSSSSKRR